MLWRHATGVLDLDAPRVVGIVNVTPDSFSDGGRLASPDDVRRHVDRLIAEGADVIDIGGESTRPRAVAVPEAEELRRLMPVIAAVHRDHPQIPISVDTVKARVAEEAIAAGASIVNDVSAFRLDPEMPALCARLGAGVILMHSRGEVSTMASFAHANYGKDVMGEVVSELLPATDRATDCGIARDRIVLDPGIGFAKRREHSLAVLAQLRRLAILGFPVLVGVSRKRFIGEITRVDLAAERVFGTVGANVAALERGARLFRVHDARASRQALDVAWAIMQTERA